MSEESICCVQPTQPRPTRTLAKAKARRPPMLRLRNMVERGKDAAVAALRELPVLDHELETRFAAPFVELEPIRDPNGRR